MGLASYLKRTALGRYVKRLVRRESNPPAAPLLRMLRKLDPFEQPSSPVIPEPYRLVRYEPGDEVPWVDLLSASGEFGRWTRDRLEKEMLSTLLPDGGVFVLRGDQRVGCASACLMEAYRPNAVLMYVTALPEHRGRGLGQALVLETMRVAQREGFPGLILHTEKHRLAAVRTYIQLGFLPEFGTDVAGKQVWSDVLSRALPQGRD
jgi:mycothiol synthase